MAQIKASGRVIEARAGILVIRLGAGPVEETHAVGAHDAGPGDYVVIYDDGTVEIGERNLRDEVIAVPMTPAPGRD